MYHQTTLKKTNVFCDFIVLVACFTYDIRFIYFVCLKRLAPPTPHPRETDISTQNQCPPLAFPNKTCYNRHEKGIELQLNPQQNRLRR